MMAEVSSTMNWSTLASPQFQAILQKSSVLMRVSNMNIEQSVIKKLRALPMDKQREVLDFTEFLEFKVLRNSSEGLVSVLEVAGDLIGCLDGGPVDLSTNQKYMDGFGEE